MKMTVWTIVQCVIPFQEGSLQTTTTPGSGELEIQQETIVAGDTAETCNVLVMLQPVHCAQRTKKQLENNPEIHTRSRLIYIIDGLRTDCYLI